MLITARLKKHATSQSESAQLVWSYLRQRELPLKGGLVAPDELETLLDAHNPTGLPRLKSPISDDVLGAMIPGDEAARRRMYQTRAAGRGTRSGGRNGAPGRAGSGSGSAQAQAVARQQSQTLARGREVHMPLSTTRELRRWFPRWASDGNGVISVRAMLGQREMVNGQERDEFIAKRQAALRVIHERRAELTARVDEPIGHGSSGGGHGGGGGGGGIEIGGNMDDWL